MAKRFQLRKIVTVLLCALMTSMLGEKSSNPIPLKLSRVECLGKCNLARLESSRREELLFRSSCFHQCLKKSKAADQQALTGPIVKRRLRKSLTNCPLSSPNQSVDWTPNRNEINVTFGQYEHTSHWYVNISWTPMNDSYGHWTGILLRYVFMSINENVKTPMCRVYLKNQTFVNLNITPYGYKYPNAIFINVLGLPYSSQLDKTGSLMKRYEPIIPTSLPVPTGVLATSGWNQTELNVSISFGVLVGLALVVGLLKLFLFRKRGIHSPSDFDLEFQYHAFIIYNKEDERWVIGKLLPLLEEKHHLKCCIHYRDFGPGLPFQESMTESVYKSHKIIAVFSDNFLKSNYCNFELDLAKYRLLNKQDDSLIIIRIDKTDYNKLPRKLRKRNFIDYSSLLERPFWEEKLLKFLNVSDDQNATVQQNFDNNTTNNDDNVMESNNARCDFSRLNSASSNDTETSTV